MARGSRTKPRTSHGRRLPRNRAHQLWPTGLAAREPQSDFCPSVRLRLLSPSEYCWLRVKACEPLSGAKFGDLRLVSPHSSWGTDRSAGLPACEPLSGANGWCCRAVLDMQSRVGSPVAGLPDKTARQRLTQVRRPPRNGTHPQLARLAAREPQSEYCRPARLTPHRDSPSED